MRRAARLKPCTVPALVLVALLPGCERQDEVPLPDDLVGTWTTFDERYADRCFSLTPTQVALGIGGDDRQRHPIEAVHRSLEDGKTVYAVVYRTAYGHDRLALHREGDDLVLENRPEVRWSRGERRP